MSAGPDRIRVDHAEDGWRWEYHSNGRLLASSARGYSDRAPALHALFLVTGVQVELPKGWRGTQEQPYIEAEFYTDSSKGWPLVVHVWDDPWRRWRKGLRRRAVPKGHTITDTTTGWACTCGQKGTGTGAYHAERAVEGEL